MGVADVAALGFAVMLKSADLAEVMFAPETGKSARPSRQAVTQADGADAAARPPPPRTLLLCHDGIFEGLLADEALEGQVLLVAAHLVVLVI